jgi:CubicO group peptidase (beta-lactamase class C family)
MLMSSVMRIQFLSLCVLFLSQAGLGQDIIDAQRKTNGITPQHARLIYEKVILFPSNTQLAIGLIRDGKLTSYGVERRGDSVVTIANQDRAFEIGSITKVFTATLLADLVLQKKIALDDPVNTHLSTMNKSNPAITFAQLANHTSGLPRLPPNLNLLLVDQSNPYKDYGPEKLDEFLSGEISLNDPPGSKYAYSNLGAGLLGYTLAKIENTTYEKLLQDRILIPLRMTNTTTDRSRATDRLVRGRNYQGMETSNWDLNVLAGAGGILSTVEDVSKFALAQFDQLNGVFALTRKPTFKIHERGDIGLGWHIAHEPPNKTFVLHSGGTGGYTSSLVLDIENRSGVIILSNVSAFNPEMRNIDKLAFEMISDF